MSDLPPEIQRYLALLQLVQDSRKELVTLKPRVDTLLRDYGGRINFNFTDEEAQTFGGNGGLKVAFANRRKYLSREVHLGYTQQFFHKLPRQKLLDATPEQLGSLVTKFVFEQKPPGGRPVVTRTYKKTRYE